MAFFCANWGPSKKKMKLHQGLGLQISFIGLEPVILNLRIDDSHWWSIPPVWALSFHPDRYKENTAAWHLFCPKRSKFQRKSFCGAGTGVTCGFCYNWRTTTVKFRKYYPGAWCAWHLAATRKIPSSAFEYSFSCHYRKQWKNNHQGANARSIVFCL